jgi:hypothetical protein
VRAPGDLIWSPENGHHEAYYIDLVEDA